MLRLFDILLHTLADAHRQVLLVVVVEDIIFVQLGSIKVNIAAGLIGIALFQQARRSAGYTHRCSRWRARTTSGRLMFSFAAVLKKGVGVKLSDLHDGFVLPPGAFEHLILAGVGVAGQMAHVGDIHHPR